MRYLQVPLWQVRLEQQSAVPVQLLPDCLQLADWHAPLLHERPLQQSPWFPPHCAPDPPQLETASHVPPSTQRLPAQQSPPLAQEEPCGVQLL